MRANWLLFAAATVAVSFSAVSATSDAGQNNQVSVHSVNSNSDQSKRFLRSNKTIEKEDKRVRENVKDDDEERVVPGTGLFDFTKTASLETLDDVAVKLAASPGSSKLVKSLHAEIDWAMIKIAALKWKPERVDEVLNIAAKRATMTDDQLMRDPDYLFSRHYREFWDARKAQA